MDLLFEQRAKQTIRRLIGEPYVGKRFKMRRMSPLLAGLGMQPSTVLDAGCEDATFTYWLADRYPGATVVGVDVDEAAIQACGATIPKRYQGRVSFDARPFADLPAETFDLAVVFDVLEHIADDGEALGQLARSLKPRGTLIAHVPRDRWMDWHGRLTFVADQDAWRINPGHVRQGYSPDALATLIAGSGLAVTHVQSWLGRWGVLAHSCYTVLEKPAPLRLLSVPVTDVCAWLDERADSSNGNTVVAVATKP